MANFHRYRGLSESDDIDSIIERDFQNRIRDLFNQRLSILDPTPEPEVDSDVLLDPFLDVAIPSLDRITATNLRDAFMNCTLADLNFGTNEEIDPRSEFEHDAEENNILNEEFREEN